MQKFGIFSPVKTCVRCETEKPATPEFFYQRKGGSKDGLRHECKTCCNEKARIWAKNNPEKRRDYQKRWALKHPGKNYESHRLWKQRNPESDLKSKYKRQYGITLADYDEMFEEQDGVCAICKLPEINRRLAVDHNHETGKIRGLLCGRCNTVLGLVEENVMSLSRAIEYIERSESE